MLNIVTDAEKLLTAGKGFEKELVASSLNAVSDFSSASSSKHFLLILKNMSNMSDTILQEQ